MSCVIITFLWTFSVKKNIQVIHCLGITARTKSNANWRMLLSHLENKLCIGFLLLLQIGNEKKYKGWGYIKGRYTSFNWVKVGHSKSLFMPCEIFTLTHIRCMYHYFVQLIWLKIVWKTNKGTWRFNEKLCMIKKGRRDNFIAFLCSSYFLRLKAYYKFTVLYAEYKTRANFFSVSTHLIQTISKAEPDVTQVYF